MIRFCGCLSKTLSSSVSHLPAVRSTQMLASCHSLESLFAETGAHGNRYDVLRRVSSISIQGHTPDTADTHNALNRTLGKFTMTSESAPAKIPAVAVMNESLPSQQRQGSDEIAAAIKNTWERLPDTPQRDAVFDELANKLIHQTQGVMFLPKHSQRDAIIRLNWAAKTLPDQCRDRFLHQLVDLLPVLPEKLREEVYFDFLMPKMRRKFVNGDTLALSMLQAISHLPEQSRQEAWEMHQQYLPPECHSAYSEAKIGLIDAIAMLPSKQRNKKFSTLVPLVLSLDREKQPEAILAMNRLVSTLPEAMQRSKASDQICLLIQGLSSQPPFVEMHTVAQTIIRHTSAEYDRDQINRIKTQLQQGLSDPAIAPYSDYAAETPTLISLLKKLLVCARNDGHGQTCSVLEAISIEMPTLLKKDVLKQAVVLLSLELTLMPLAMQAEILMTLRDCLNVLQSELLHKIDESPQSAEVKKAYRVKAYAQVTDALSLVARKKR